MTGYMRQRIKPATPWTAKEKMKIIATKKVTLDIC
jgi:hypothetical protein